MNLLGVAAVAAGFLWLFSLFGARSFGKPKAGETWELPGLMWVATVRYDVDAGALTRGSKVSGDTGELELTGAEKVSG